MLISKKELLQETGISYGQLYRWKREGLIPEEWFIKQPSFTGQETFFPRAKMLNRIHAIQELKEKYSLEELANILSPESTQKNFLADNLQVLEEIDPALIPSFLDGFGKTSFHYIDILLMVTLSELKKQFNIPNEQIAALVQGISSCSNHIRSSSYIFLLLQCANTFYASIYREGTEVYIDSRLRVIEKVLLNDVSSRLKVKYRKGFPFRFSDDEPPASKRRTPV